MFNYRFVVLFLISLLSVKMVHSIPYGSTMLYPTYSRHLNSLNAGYYGGYSGSASSLGLFGSFPGHYYGASSPTSYGTRHGQGFIGNPGIGITQSSETLTNVYGPPMVPSQVGGPRLLQPPPLPTYGNAIPSIHTMLPYSSSSSMPFYKSPTLMMTPTAYGHSYSSPYYG